MADVKEGTVDGGFMPATFNAVGDPYKERPRARVHESMQKRQFQTCNLKVGQTADNWGEGKRDFLRLSENEPYAEPFRREMNQRLANVRKMNTPNGFQYSSPAQDHSTPGDYHGSFGIGPQGTPYPHLPEDEQQARRTKRAEESFAKKNIQANPGKKGTYGYVGTALSEYEYTEDPYDAACMDNRREIRQHHDLVGDRKAFKSMCHASDFFDGMEHTAASKVYSWDGKCSMKPADPEEKMTRKQRVEAKADGVLQEGFKVFVPSSYTKSTVADSTLEAFPEYMPTGFSEKMLRKYMMPDRNGPTEEMMLKYGCSDAIMERKAFKSTSCTKSKPTPSVCLMNITSRMI